MNQFWILDDLFSPSVLRAAQGEYDEMLKRSKYPGVEASWQKNKTQFNDVPLFPTFTRQLAEETNGEGTLQRLSRMVDNPLYPDRSFCGGGMHFMRRGGRLDPHIDFSMHKEDKSLFRALNMILFLNPCWYKEWGGCLEMWDENGLNRLLAVYPKFGRAVIFRTTDTSWHSVSKVTCPSYITRKTFAAFYYTKNVPHYGDMPSTFKARPGEEWRQFFLWPLERRLKRIASSLKKKTSKIFR